MYNVHTKVLTFWFQTQLYSGVSIARIAFNYFKQQNNLIYVRFDQPFFF